MIALGALLAFGCGAPSAAPRAPQGAASGAAAAETEPAPASATPSASASASASPEEVRALAIQRRFGNACRLAHECGALWGIDCDTTVDGPYYYVEAQTLKVVARCGGYCDGSLCTSCPPRTWTCSNP